MSITLSPRSLERLSGAHPDLARVIKRAAVLSPIDFTVLEVLRTVERQRELVAKGASKTMKSRHLAGTDGKSRAVDIAPMIGGQVSWDWPLFIPLAKVVQQASRELSIPIRWGGTWKLLADTPEISTKILSRSFPDGPHFELPVGAYP